ncbi:MAG: DMT family transporter [Planctomycetota bacterium]|jgi:drug/metabolite transporter (DMT)-like permease
MAREHQKLKGVLLLMAANGCFCLAGILVKSASEIGPLKIAFLRFAVGLGLVMAVSCLGRFKLEFNDKRLLLVRGICGGVAIYIAFLAISRLGLGKGTLLICCYPIFACLFSAIFLKERFGVYGMVAVFVALTGIYLVSRDNESSFSMFRTFGKYEIITIIGAVISGIVVTTIRKLHDTDNSLSIYFSQCLGGLALFAVPALAGEWDLSTAQWLIMVGVGVCATVGQLMMTQGFRYVPVRIGALFGMLDPVLAYAAGVVIFGERVSFVAVFGAVLVLGACSMVLAGRKGERTLPQAS